MHARPGVVVRSGCSCAPGLMGVGAPDTTFTVTGDLACRGRAAGGADADAHRADDCAAGDARAAPDGALARHRLGDAEAAGRRHHRRGGLRGPARAGGGFAAFLWARPTRDGVPRLTRLRARSFSSVVVLL